MTHETLGFFAISDHQGKKIHIYIFHNYLRTLDINGVPKLACQQTS